MSPPLPPLSHQGRGKGITTHRHVRLDATLGQPAPCVVVGHQMVQAGHTAAALNAEDGTLAVCVAGSDLSQSPPGDTQAQVSVEVVCVPNHRLEDEWRIGIYASLMRAYELQLAAYRSRSGTGKAPSCSPLAYRQIEHTALHNACLRVLLERMVHLTGAEVGRHAEAAWASPPTAFEVYQPRYLQFFDQVLEWTEMTYSFYSHPPAAEDGWAVGGLAGDDDALFAKFLQADQARVPVQPRDTLAFLYFFSSGMLWIADARLVPSNPADVPLVNDIKHAALKPSPPPCVGRCWEVMVPTSMQVLDESPGALGPLWPTPVAVSHKGEAL